MPELNLVPIQNLNPVAVFCEGGLESILNSIEAQVASLTFDIQTARGRKDCASVARKVASSKTYLDKIGKELVDDLKAKAKLIDAPRKMARDFLDELRDRVRAPLTEYEEAEKARIAAEALAAEILQAHAEALHENELIDREKELERQKAELAKLEADRLARIETERKIAERKEREERIALEAAEKARKEAEDLAEHKRAVERERERTRIQELEQAERDAKAAAEEAVRDRVEAVEQAKRDREAAVKAAEEKIRLENERVERERVEKEAAELKEAERVARNKNHRARIEREAVADLIEHGIGELYALALFQYMSEGGVRHVTVNY